MLATESQLQASRSPLRPDDVEVMPERTISGCLAAPRTVPTSSRRWGVILAGGEGNRLRNLTRLISGDDRPKQFCPLVGEATLVEHTRRRAEWSIPGGQILFSLSAGHGSFYAQESGIKPSQRLVQPENRGTAPPIIHGLLSIHRNDRDALVAILPSDHHYEDEPAFAFALETAFEVAAANPESVVLIGARPTCPEVQFGWIELGRPAGSQLYRVRGFREKPALGAAMELFARGGLLSTFVMVGGVAAWLDLANRALGDLTRPLAGTSLWSGEELLLPGSAYNAMPTLDFSKDVLSSQPQRLLALDPGFTGWNDLGEPERVMRVLQKNGLTPPWAREWSASQSRLTNTRFAENTRSALNGAIVCACAGTR